jgi:hypothetical protein
MYSFMMAPSNTMAVPHMGLANETQYSVISLIKQAYRLLGFQHHPIVTELFSML